MEDKIPIPTDNIFKFYALFGLLLFVFSVGSTIYLERSTRELVFQAAIDVATIEQTPNPSAVDKIKMQVLEKRIEAVNAETKFISSGTGIIIAISMGLMIYGFTKWHKDIQPVQDEMAKLQLAKLRHEVEHLTHKEPPSDQRRHKHSSK